MSAPNSVYRLPPLSSGDIGGARYTWRATAGGSGTPLVLLHGIGSNARAWAGQFSDRAGFAGHRPIMAWNAPGYGGSTPLAASWPTADDYASSLEKLVDHLGFERFVLVGQSLGAIMATRFALRWPDRVAGLLLASPARGYKVKAGGVMPAHVQARIDDLIELGSEAFAEKRHIRLLTNAASPEVQAIVRQAMSEVEVEGYGAAVHFLAVSDLISDVAKLTSRPVVVWGAEDIITTPDACREVAVAARANQIIECPGGHAFATETPAAFNTVLRPLLRAADEQNRKNI